MVDEKNVYCKAANKPFPIRLKELKPKLQEDAFAKNISLSNQIIGILRQYYRKRGVVVRYYVRPPYRKIKSGQMSFPFYE